MITSTLITWNKYHSLDYIIITKYFDYTNI